MVLLSHNLSDMYNIELYKWICWDWLSLIIFLFSLWNRVWLVLSNQLEYNCSLEPWFLTVLISRWNVWSREQILHMSLAYLAVSHTVFSRGVIWFPEVKDHVCQAASVYHTLFLIGKNYFLPVKIFRASTRKTIE